MKLAFPDGDRDDFTVGKGSFSIGSTDQDDVVLDNGVAGHAILTVDQRGITLSVDDLPQEAVEVNGRSVQRRAILRLGDRINIGGTAMVLRGEPINTATPPHAFKACIEAGEPARILIRGLTGTYSGRVFPVADTVRIGSASDADIPIEGVGEVRLAVGCADDRLFLRHEGGQELLDVNGYAVKHAELTPGDQLAIGDERLLVEAPNFVPGRAYTEEQREGRSNTQVFQALSLGDDKPPRAPQRDAGQASPERGPQTVERAPAGRWDAAIISVCAILSAAMLAWLFFNL